jgi:hypothetical protein
MQIPMFPVSGETLGHVRGTLDVSGQDVFDPAVRTHRVVEGVDRCAGEAKCLRRALKFQDFTAVSTARILLTVRSLSGRRVVPRRVAGPNGPARRLLAPATQRSVGR